MSNATKGADIFEKILDYMGKRIDIAIDTLEDPEAENRCMDAKELAQYISFMDKQGFKCNIETNQKAKNLGSKIASLPVQVAVNNTRG